MRESEIEAYLVKRVKALGGEVRKVQWIGRRGAPDRLVMLPERGRGALPDQPWTLGLATGGAPTTREAEAIWVELKAPGKAPTLRQKNEHRLMRRMGQRVEVIDSLEGVDALLS